MSALNYASLISVVDVVVRFQDSLKPRVAINALKRAA